ncbi:uncharacterized protein LOC119391436 [Rhipicephalus sanguineus]|uniref:uncharacterized protein LOC119391436 n=1 Tax=Rhipicephalus sanguineus TaxID=34632 RepID=UPI0020C28CCE|nr:uncharacterized protein LOC119391436 [Rhipicephalus sanguineus]
MIMGLSQLFPQLGVTYGGITSKGQTSRDLHGSKCTTATAYARTTSPKVPSQILPKHGSCGRLFPLLQWKWDPRSTKDPPWKKPRLLRLKNTLAKRASPRLQIPARHRFTPNPQCLDHLAFPRVDVRMSVRRARKHPARINQLPHHLTEAQRERCIHRRPQPSSSD